MITIETRIKDESLFPLLEQCSYLFSRLERLLFKALYMRMEKLNDAKRRFIAEHRITARQFNAVHRQLEARVESWREARKLNLATLKRHIEKTHRSIGAAKSPFVAHQKKRRLQLLLARKDWVIRELEAKVPSICFGSRATFREQFHLKENFFADHAAWRTEWRARRSSSFLALGSADETSGNETCQYRDGTLHLRLPDALGGETVPIPVAFRYRELDFLGALTPAKQRLTQGPRKGTEIERCSAVSYRFIRRDNHWSVQAIFDVPAVAITTELSRGCVGIDVNPWGLAVTRNDRCGNPIGHFDIPWSVEGRTADQIAAAIGDAVSQAVLHAKLHHVPIARERLDFAVEKAEDRGPKANRMLSAFAYSAFEQMIRGRCAREGVELIGVNPAFTTVIGQGKFAHGYGLSGHQAAACAIARRAQHFGEKLRTRSAGTALTLPARNRARHVWHDWGRWAKARRPHRSRSSKPKGSPGSKPASDRRASSDPPPPNGRTANGRAGGATLRIDAAFAPSGATPEANGRRHCSGGLDRSSSPRAKLARWD
jgi:IS605 OrfB family transposase